MKHEYDSVNGRHCSATFLLANRIESDVLAFGYRARAGLRREAYVASGRVRK